MGDLKELRMREWWKEREGKGGGEGRGGGGRGARRSEQEREDGEGARRGDRGRALVLNLQGTREEEQKPDRVRMWARNAGVRK